MSSLDADRVTSKENGAPGVTTSRSSDAVNEGACAAAGPAASASDAATTSQTSRGRFIIRRLLPIFRGRTAANRAQARPFLLQRLGAALQVSQDRLDLFLL